MTQPITISKFNGEIDTQTYTNIMNAISAYETDSTEYVGMLIEVTQGVILDNNGLLINCRLTKSTIDGEVTIILDTQEDAYLYPTHLHRYDLMDAQTRFGEIT